MTARPFRKFGLGPLALLLSLPVLAQQQAVAPHIGFLYPAGARQGAAIEVTVGGQMLAGASEAYVSGTGVTATVKQYIRPLTPGQANMLREQMQQLASKQRTPAEDKTLAEIRSKLADFVRRPSSPAIAETVILQITAAADAKPSERQIRLVTSNGLTNPFVFNIGQLPEYSRPPAKVPPAFNVANGATPPSRFQSRQPEPPAAITLPAVLNGQMMPGTSDRYRFHAAKGQRLVIAASARELIPYISDAVPGWFQAVLTLRDASGKELATADHYLFHPDPLLYYEVPADADFLLEIHDSIYRGREDFIYRIAVGELPFLTSIFPLGAKSGSRTAIEARGWNLPRTAIAQDTKGKSKGIYPVALANSNPLPFSVDSLPEITARDSNTRKEKALRIKLPVIVNGRVSRPGESAFYRFEGRAGEEVVAQVFARRLESPLDSVLRLTDAQGKELASNDDFEDKTAGMITHQADSRISFKLPAKGAYYLQLADTQRQGGPECAYRLRVTHPEPDFELRVVPSSINIRAGANMPITVYAIRRDGFAGEIALKLKDAPAGFALSGAIIPSGQDKVRLTMQAPQNPARPFEMRLEGQAEIGGRTVRRTGIPAEDMMQAFAYHHLVPEDSLMVRVIGAGPARFPTRVASDKPLKIPAAGSVPLQLPLPPRLLNQVRVALNEPPDGISIQNVTPSRDGVSVTLHVEPGKVKPGLKGNLILDAFIERANPAGGAAARRRQPIGALPAIPFEIVDTKP